MEDLKKFACKLYFYDKPEQIPSEYQAQDFCIVCNKEISSDLYEPIIIWTCKHLSHWSCMLNKDECPCENNEEIDKEISTDENVELAARVLMKLSQNTASSLELEGFNEEIHKLAPKRNKKNISKYQNEETILASSTNSPFSKQSPSFESVEQSQKEINLVSLESKSQEEINLVSLESEPQKSQRSSKQLPKYPVSAKNSNKKIPIAEFIQKITTATSSDDMDVKNLAQLFQMAYRNEKELQRIKQKKIQNWYNYAEVFEDRVGQLIVDGYEDNAARTELYDEIFPLIS
ncbi:12725_t:CDS:2, partial [Racocetra persica]